MRKEDLIKGRRSVKEALLAGEVEKLYLQPKSRSSSLKEILSLAKSSNIPVETLSVEEFNALAGLSVHQGVLAQAVPYHYLSWEEMCDRLESYGEQLILMLDHLQDPHNLGALLRTAEAAGVKHVVIPRNRSVQVNSTVRKVAAGAAEWVSVVRVTNLVQAARHLQKMNFWLYGTDDSGGVPYYEADWQRGVVLALGAEGKGLSRLLRETCDQLIYIPMSGNIESLNVSVAGGILMYEFNRCSVTSGER